MFLSGGQTETDKERELTALQSTGADGTRDSIEFARSGDQGSCSVSGRVMPATTSRHSTFT